MALLKIAQLGEPVLRQRARPVSRDELGGAEMQRLIDDMTDTMRDASGAGLAAPQVYRSLQVVVMELSHNPRYEGASGLPLTVLINPRVEALVETDPLADEDSMWVYEGCLSVAGLRGRVRRPRRVAVTAWDRRGAVVELELEGFSASVIQHEVDHLLGTLFVDRALAGTLTFLREFERHVPPEARVVDGQRRS